ncbi:MAG: methionyl-tRNA formyltransferase [Saprospiraceae bacterium]
MKIVFFGTPDFAVQSLARIHTEFELLAVVTAVDKPAGRGHLLQFSAVKNWALQHNINVLQPKNLKSKNFLRELELIKADLFIVVAFRMLPKQVWNFPKYGTVNLHASLLPDYRGAAPIQRAIMAGEKTSGVSCFILRDEIDTGDIILQESIDISPIDTGGTLHDKMSIIGAELLVKSIFKLQEKTFLPIPQETYSNKIAPKIFPEDCIINWDDSAMNVYNFIRALSPYPTAKTHYKESSFKIFRTSISTEKSNADSGVWKLDLINHTLKIACVDYFLIIEEIQEASKKRMNIKEYINGLKNK